MTTEIKKMFDELIAFLRASGVDVPQATAQEVEARLYHTYGGERVYIPHRPTQRHQVQLAKLGKLETRKLALATGLTMRRIRQIKNGK